MAHCLLFDAQGRTPHRVYEGAARVLLFRAPESAVAVAPGLAVLRVREFEGAPIATARCVGRDVHAAPDGPGQIKWMRAVEPAVLYALAVLQHREQARFHPGDGEELGFADPTTGATNAGKLYFPRIDPAVIGLITTEVGGEELVLLGQNAERRGFYSLIAGYVGLGETFEEALEREVREETGRRITDARYVASQPWPYSGSIMIGMRAQTSDFEQVLPRDEELSDILWATKCDVREQRIPLPRRGSIALRMLREWVAE